MASRAHEPHDQGRDCPALPLRRWYCQVDDVSTNIGYLSAMMTTSKSIDRGDRFPADVIQRAVWLYFRFPLSLRMVEDLLAARGIIASTRASTTGQRIRTCRRGGGRGS
jgi:hypothetical protein